VDTSKAINHISLCAGYGGIDLGLRRVFPTCRTVAYVEIEAFAVANLVAKMEEGELDQAPIWTNLKTLPLEAFPTGLEIISGGFPCQPFSAAGKREGDEDPRHLFPYIKNAIRTIQPRIVFLENVEGIISAKLKGDGWEDPAGTPVLLHVIRELERVGYRATAGVFSAAEVGATHQRKRVFILAHSKGAGLERHVGVQTGCSEPGRDSSQPAGSVGRGDCSGTFWPARPGEPQHEWEEPRVVGDAASAELYDEGKRAEGRTGITGSGEGAMAHSDPDRLQKCSVPDEQGAEDHKADGQSKRQTESELGGTVDGSTSGLDPTANRVDRLRLLGNGVVPDTAEVAFRTLYKELMDEQQSNQS